MGVYRFTSEHEDLRSVSFHMPGHKGSALYRRFGRDAWLRDFPDRDITEIAGADNLFQPGGIIAETMSKYRSLYDTKATYLLINGSSAGIIASMMTCAGPGEKIIMARNCHKAVFNALRLGDIEPAYVYPEMIRAYGIAGRVMPEDVETAIRENPDAKAIILPSPNYYGICSDIETIAKLAHEAGIYLIVDQAHGAHLKLFETSDKVVEKKILKGANIVGHSDPGAYDSETAESGSYCTEDDLSIDGDAFAMHEISSNRNPSTASRSDKDGSATRYLPEIPLSAETCGADLVINSTHKTLGSMTQSAILNVCGSGIDIFDLEDKLQMIQSTSPSYILMESLDINADILDEHADQLIGEWYSDLIDFYGNSKYIPGLKVMKAEGLDPTKLNLDMSRIGLDGAALDEELRQRGIFAELATGNILMCMTGIGNTSGDYEKLTDALKEIAWKYGKDLIEAMRGSDEENPAWREGMEGFDEVFFEDEEPVGSDGSECDKSITEASVWTTRRKIHEIPTAKELIPIEGSAGRICATALIPYPPGIPLVCPGEEMTEEDVDYIIKLRSSGENVIGVDPEGRISVGI